jgi:hypothetical protein
MLSKTSAAREDIGAIRILDNYSFVQVRTEAADKIIAALNGQVFRGRTLTVDHARARSDSTDPTSADETLGADARPAYDSALDRSDTSEAAAPYNADRSGSDRAGEVGQNVESEALSYSPASIGDPSSVDTPPAYPAEQPETSADNYDPVGGSRYE